jgi:hypothetical protein
MEYDRPFIASRNGFKRNQLALDAIDFLKVETVPEDFRKCYYLLLSFFQKGGLPVVCDQFQQLVNILCYAQGPRSKRELKLVLENIFLEPLTATAVETMPALFNVLVFHLALKNKIHLPPVPIFGGPRAGRISFSPWFNKLPPEVRFWCVASTRSILEKHRESLDPMMVKFALEWYDKHKDPKMFSSSAVLIRHYFAYLGVSSFDLSAFAEVRKLTWALTTNMRTPSPALWLYSQFYGEDLSEPFKKKLAETEVKIGLVPRIYQHDIIDTRKKAGLADPYDLNSGASHLGIDHGIKKTIDARANTPKGRKLATVIGTVYGNVELRPNLFPRPDGCSIYELRAKSSFQIGGYFINDKILSRYRPDHLYDVHPESIWLAHQKDFLENGYEKGTKKSKSSALRILNAYIFSYLEWFAENVDPDFQVPKVLEDFDPNIFVRHTNSFLMRVKPNKVLPATFPEFHSKCLDLGVDGVKANINSVQASQRNISLYFESYIKLEGLSIQNPMDIAPNIRGFSYAEAQKKKVDYDYWWLLKEFLFAFSSCALCARKDLIGVSFDQEVWKKKFLKYAEKTELRLGYIELDLSKIDWLENFDPNTIHVVATFFCFVSQCGIRFSNAFWLDARTFDAKITGNEKEDDYIEVVVNTDKAKLKPFNTHVDVSVMELLRMLNEIRKSMFTDETVFYQNNEKSKWGEITPLFRFSADKHTENDVEAVEKLPKISAWL